MLNPIEHLKFELLAGGMRLTEDARERLTGSNRTRPLTLADYATTSGIPLRLPGNIWVNVPLQEFNPNFVRDPRHLLDVASDGFVIRAAVECLPVEPIPVPNYCQRVNAAGEPYERYGLTHTDRVRISPIGGCANACSFCDLPRTSAYVRKPVDRLLECVSVALHDEVLPARHVLISGGTPKPGDYCYLLDVYAQVLAAFPGTPIDIMMLPLPGLLDPVDLRARGVNELSINLELFNEHARLRLMRQKAAISRHQWLAFLEAAVQAGMGVRSLLIVGLEPIEDTLRGVEAIAERGAEPVLSPFRPAPGTPLESEPPPSADLLVDAFMRSREVAQRRGARLGPKCLPCQHNTLSLPDGSEYYHA
jgi:hypothetical protein